MHVLPSTVGNQETPQHPEPLLARKPGTIGVTLRLDPPRYDRLKRLVRRLSTTNQSVLRSALDNRMVVLERQPHASRDVEGQISLFAPIATARESWKPAVQDSFGFARPEPTIALTNEAAELLILVHRRCQEAHGAYRACSLARRGESWMPNTSPTDWLATSCKVG